MSRGRRFSDDDVARMHKLRLDGMPCQKIDAELKLRPGASYQVLRARGLLATKFSAHQVQPAGEHKRPPNSVLIERDRATNATPSLTATLCGDPLPGRSALDKRNGAST